MIDKKDRIALSGGRYVTVHPTGLRPFRGKRVLDAAAVVASMSKGERRHVRKSLRDLGRIDLVQASLTPLSTIEALQRN